MTIRTIWSLPAIIACLVLITVEPALGQSSRQRVRVELELVAERGFAVTGQQKWLRFLKDFKLDNLRIRGGRPGDRPAIKTRETSGVVTHRVVGLLTPGDKLAVPGGLFRYGDRAGLTAWLDKIRGNGEDGLYARNMVFGLTEKQLVSLHEQLAAKVEFSTRGEQTADVIQRIGRGLPLRVTIDPAARRALAGNQPVRDELRGMGSGSAIAAALRPLGLVVAPQRQGTETLMRIGDVREVRESWPIGWPSSKGPGVTLPKLFKRLNVEIGEISVEKAVAAIQQRLEVPVLFDHNSLARKGIDIQREQVSLPPVNTYYKEILDRLLKQAKLKSEIRVDEAGRPFVWISTRS